MLKNSIFIGTFSTSGDVVTLFPILLVMLKGHSRAISLTLKSVFFKFNFIKGSLLPLSAFNKSALSIPSDWLPEHAPKLISKGSMSCCKKGSSLTWQKTLFCIRAVVCLSINFGEHETLCFHRFTAASSTPKTFIGTLCWRLLPAISVKVRKTELSINPEISIAGVVKTHCHEFPAVFRQLPGKFFTSVPFGSEETMPDKSATALSIASSLTKATIFNESPVFMTFSIGFEVPSPRLCMETFDTTGAFTSTIASMENAALRALPSLSFASLIATVTLRLEEISTLSQMQTQEGVQLVA